MSLVKHDNSQAFTDAPLGPTLFSSLVKAIEMRNDHRKAYEDHSKTFDDITISDWTKMVEDWEADQNKPNPYEVPETCEYGDGNDYTMILIKL